MSPHLGHALIRKTPDAFLESSVPWAKAVPISVTKGMSELLRKFVLASVGQSNFTSEIIFVITVISERFVFFETMLHT